MRLTEREGLGRPILAAIAVIVVAIAGVAVYMVLSNTAPPNSSACTTSSGGGSTVQVSIYKGSGDSTNPPGYSPDTITLVIGVNNTVTWTNNDSVHHTVTTTNAPAGGSFNSGNMNAGVSCSHTFTVAGTYDYDCAYHSWMTGTVIVKASA